MNTQTVDVLVVGAGHAGLSASYHLKQLGLEHLVLERGRIGESWRSQRWDSFTLNTANKLNALPGHEHADNDPDGFCSANALATYLADYALAFQLPVVEQTSVLSIVKNAVSDRFEVTVSQQGRVGQYACRQVILASGAMNEQQIPAFAGSLPSHIRQLHVGDYRRASQLPPGAVLVVGSGQSGCQIAEDLADAGRTVYLSTSSVARLPRRYRGKDIMDWLIQMNFFEMRAEDAPDPAMLHMRTPQLTGTGGGRRTISLQSLARKGVAILGKLAGLDAQTAFFQPDAPTHVTFADGFSAQVKTMIDGFIAGNQLTAPAPEPDPDDTPDTGTNYASAPASLDFNEQAITSIVWATGFGADFSYVNLPVFDKEGNPAHREGIAGVEGVYFLGLHWLRSRKSTILFGIKDDAKFIAETVYAHHQQRLETA